MPNIAKTLLLDVIDGGHYGVLTDISADSALNAIPFRMVTSDDGNTVTLFLSPPPDDNTSDALDRVVELAARDAGAPSAMPDEVIVPALPATPEPT